MGLLKQAAVALIACVLVTGDALARPLTDAERRLLADTVARFDAGIDNKDYAVVFNTIPPRVVDYLAKSAGLTVEDVRKSVIKQMQELVTAVDIESFGMSLSEAEYFELPSGEPYVLIPTEIVMQAEGRRTKAKSPSLALLDEGVWYLLRVNDVQQVDIMRQVYPEFIGIEFPRGSMEALN